MITLTVLPWVWMLLGAAFVIALWRLLRGPSLPDRVLALDTAYVLAMAGLLLHGLLSGSTVLFEAALVIALLGFVATVAFARFIEGEAPE